MLPLFATAPAWAQDAVWSATLSTEWSSEYKAISNIDLFGCVNGLSFIADCSDPTKLTDDDFTHGTPSATYTIIEMGFADTEVDDKFFLRLSGLTSTAAKTALAGLTLNVGSAAYSMADARALDNDDRLTWGE